MYLHAHPSIFYQSSCFSGSSSVPPSRSTSVPQSHFVTYLLSVQFLSLFFHRLASLQKELLELKSGQHAGPRGQRILFTVHCHCQCHSHSLPPPLHALSCEKFGQYKETKGQVISTLTKLPTMDAV